VEVRVALDTNRLIRSLPEHDLRLITRDGHFENIPQLLRG